MKSMILTDFLKLKSELFQDCQALNCPFARDQSCAKSAPQLDRG